MPGAYAHLTLLRHASNFNRLHPRVSEATLRAVRFQNQFCQLGAVSPDYPYLAIGDSGATEWADAMHYTHTVAMLRTGAEQVAAMQGRTHEKCLAWLFGYASHMVADATIHPVVELKVGSYQGNEKAHRICEFHQDAYIWQPMNLGDIGLSEYLDAGIALCTDPDDRDALDSDVVALWNTMLRENNGDIFRKFPPHMNAWHQGFSILVDDIAEEGNRLLPFIRDALVLAGATYPAPDEVDDQYIKSLKAPGEPSPLSYDTIFSHALENVLSTWEQLDLFLQGQQPFLAGTDTWNLDTGRDDHGGLVFWSGA